MQTAGAYARRIVLFLSRSMRSHALTAGSWASSSVPGGHRGDRSGDGLDRRQGEGPHFWETTETVEMHGFGAWLAHHFWADEITRKTTKTGLVKIVKPA